MDAIIVITFNILIFVYVPIHLNCSIRRIVVVVVLLVIVVVVFVVVVVVLVVVIGGAME